MENNKYIVCSFCDHWTLEDRHIKSCKQCNNSGFVVNPTTILCNMCGGHTRFLNTMNEQSVFGLENCTVSAGYESYHLLDCTQYTFNLCEKCLRQLFIQFKIPPKIDGYDYETEDNDYTWETDQKIYNYRLWEDAGGHHQAYLNKKCNKEQDCPNEAKYSILTESGEFTENCACEEHKQFYVNIINVKVVKFISPELRSFM
jgi:hypothetical protein